MEEKSFFGIVNKNWEIITLSIIASFCFQIFSEGSSVSQKIIFVLLTAIILNLVISSFQWGIKQHNKMLFLLLILIWLIVVFLLELTLPILVNLTN
jgi:hypothetical protein